MPALTNAINTGRVGHAYLFTGARGVGKTSAARIFAKALNCDDGPAAEAVQRVRHLPSDQRRRRRGRDRDRRGQQPRHRRDPPVAAERQHAAQPARYKIYIIDEVHMLTREAFNALLKTLEEPPEHVKFIFCTTEPEKIPITILSRCQRFDFAGIQTQSIVQRLRQIVDGRRGRGRAGGAGNPGPAGGRLDARQPVAAWSNCWRFRRADHGRPTCTTCSARPASRCWSRWSGISSTAIAAGVGRS